jgi:hypothetical protein
MDAGSQARYPAYVQPLLGYLAPNARGGAPAIHGTAWLLPGVALGIALCAVGWLAWRKWRRPLTAEERERRRRLQIEAEGRVCDGVLIEFRGPVVYYRYQVSGAEYLASQDLTGLLHDPPAHLTGHASVKYLPENPANSIVLSEHWSGLHQIPPPSGDEKTRCSRGSGIQG